MKAKVVGHSFVDKWPVKKENLCNPENAKKKKKKKKKPTKTATSSGSTFFASLAWLFKTNDVLS